ncbi:phosphate ABC transporter permease subunit PstC [Paracoccus homiensis]|uniref:Phosphate transport system permease protein n=1 Tax=Paracoccus homiensis TaxID=364199 RepID=A0A1H9Z1K8_9RHOB|nr:phosphate ABC transporter permease subunit PstC [Paracoccus homiensis]SES75236.1 phosphate ABC transporter membrane protein 1, PhoT family [Paracoccus homiensis]
MSIGLLLLIVVGLGVIGYILGRRRALASVAGDPRKLHSLPSQYGQSVFLFTVVPALLLLIVWLLAAPSVIDGQVRGTVTTDGVSQSEIDLKMADVGRISDGLGALMAANDMSEDDLTALTPGDSDLRGQLAAVGVAVGADVEPAVFEAAKHKRSLTNSAGLIRTVLILLVALAGLAYAMTRIRPDFRARNVSEAVVKALLLGSSLIAILTTVGIVLSLIFETMHFFRLYPAKDFFLSLTWNPQFRGGSDLGVWPLIWGTLYVSFIALLVAVPIGLLAAIYLAEYATKRVRSVAKPLIEILAGIPTIVYGLFALITVGPMLRDYFAQPLGLGNSSSSVMTAGLVMGIMLIPFVSSLSDDIINSVPQSMRDGSYGLGATKSESIKQVILPAALPGVVGAVLLAASRAIGETMIVVLGAGAAAKLSMNPFEAMTTVTVKIVSQLTGDTEFASPETLVAFALGLTLFVFTLGLNVLALYIVRKYREQYE